MKSLFLAIYLCFHTPPQAFITILLTQTTHKDIVLYASDDRSLSEDYFYDSLLSGFPHVCITGTFLEPLK